MSSLIGALSLLARLAGPPLVAEPPVDETEPAAPDSRSEAELTTAATAAYEAGDFERVVELAAAAYALTGEVRHLYAQAQAEHARGNCAAALALYGRVLASDPDGELGGYAAEQIHRCESRLDQEAAVEEDTVQPETPAPEPETSPVPPPDPPAVLDHDESKSKRVDPLGTALLGSGLAVAAGGTTLTLLARSAANQARDTNDEATYTDHRNRWRGMLIGGSIALGVGGALLVGAAVRYGLVARSRGVGVATTGTGLTLHGRF